MRRLALLVLVLPLAACGGGKTATNPANTGSRDVTKPLARAIVVQLRGVIRGTAKLRRAGTTQTAVTLSLGVGTGSRTVTAELDRGSCAAPKGLHVTKPLGVVRNADQSWSVTAPLTKLTAAPLALVIRGAHGAVVGCGQVRAA